MSRAAIAMAFALALGLGGCSSIPDKPGDGQSVEPRVLTKVIRVGPAPDRILQSNADWEHRELGAWYEVTDERDMPRRDKSRLLRNGRRWDYVVTFEHPFTGTSSVDASFMEPVPMNNDEMRFRVTAFPAGDTVRVVVTTEGDLDGGLGPGEPGFAVWCARIGPLRVQLCVTEGLAPAEDRPLPVQRTRR